MSPNRPRRLTGLIGLIATISASFNALAAPPINATDLQLIQRVTFGPTQETLQAFATKGRQQWLADQLRYAGDACLPAAVSQRIQQLDIQNKNPLDSWQEMRAKTTDRSQAGSEPLSAEQQRLRQEDKNKRLALIRQFKQENWSQAFERRTLRALYCTNQLQERLIWFWYNHFNVFRSKGTTYAFISDYEEQAIRPHVLGKFQNLLMATLTHPAMMVYLDNTRNIKGKPNENYAREIMELHTMGVDGGYTQKDVQELARILTGARTHMGPKPLEKAKGLAKYYVIKNNGFVFDPRLHDSADKVFLNQTFKGSKGFDEIDRAVTILSHHPATAHFISRKLATYFLADDPPDTVVNQMAQVFLQTDGDIAAVLRTLLAPTLFDTNVRSKFKDPTHYIYSSIRLLYDGRVIEDTEPVNQWISRLGANPYTHLSPEGYGMTSGDWASADQMIKRLTYAQQIASGNKLFEIKSRQAQNSKNHKLKNHYLNQPNIVALKATYDSPKLAVMLPKTNGLQAQAALILSSPAFMEY